jgi:hypothetical protein
MESFLKYQKLIMKHHGLGDLNATKQDNLSYFIHRLV